MTPLLFDISDLPQVFADVTPVPQNDGPTAVCRIDYPPLFVQAYNYFRALLLLAEYSPRALRLTELCLEQNSANYTVWHYRRLCLYSSNCNKNISHATTAATEEEKDKNCCMTLEDLQSELEFATRLGGENPKNYQIWYHRRAIVQEFATLTNFSNEDDSTTVVEIAKAELAYVATVLAVDGKNYHAWSHRQWILKSLLLSLLPGNEETWEKELTYTEELIEQDIRNNSAWNQRWFVTHRGGTSKANAEMASNSNEAVAEMEFALEKAAQDPYNESPFSYFLAVAKELKRSNAEKWKNEILPTFAEKLNALACGNDADNDDNVSPYILSTRAEWLIWQGDKDAAVVLLDRLAQVVDPIRCKYWALRKAHLPQPAEL